MRARLLACLFAGLLAAPGFADSREQQVQSDVRELLNATYDGEVDTVLRLSHPVVIDALGGKVEARKTLSEAMGRLKNYSLKIEVFEFPAEPQFVDGDQRSYAVVPTRLVVSAGDKKIDSQNFQVGVKQAGDDAWKYVEGPKFKQYRSEHFSDFPADFDYPEISKLK